VNAAVDIGTNTVRMLLGEVSSGRVCPHFYFRRITRLGGGAGVDGRLTQDAMDRTLAAVLEASQLIRQSGVQRLRVVGTEALRRACNGSHFVQQVLQRTGLPLEVIDGNEEARLSAEGVMAALDPPPRCCLIFDIGGGSSEFVLVNEGKIVFHRSFPLGVVSIADSHMSAAEIAERIGSVLGLLCGEMSESGLLQIASSEKCILVGTAGTVTTLAAIQLEMSEYDWRRVNNLCLNMTDLEHLNSRLAPLSALEREALPGMEKGRGDLILPGLQIVLELMRRMQSRCLTVSDFGLLEGLLLSLSPSS